MTAIVDIMNCIGRCIVSGDVRQTAEIAFGSATSAEYLDLKVSVLRRLGDPSEAACCYFRVRAGLQRESSPGGMGLDVKQQRVRHPRHGLWACCQESCHERRTWVRVDE